MSFQALWDSAALLRRAAAWQHAAHALKRLAELDPGAVAVWKVLLPSRCFDSARPSACRERFTWASPKVLFVCDAILDILDAADAC
jgi:hypothetical protein